MANTLLFDVGDILQGTPMGDCLAQDRSAGRHRPHPAIAAMNVLGYDAATLGNHDFDYGLDALIQTVLGARFPIVSANLVTRRGDRPTADRTLLPPWTVLDRHVRTRDSGRMPIRIGVLGLLPPQVTAWHRDLLADRVETRDMLEAARDHLPALHAAGADIVVALAHTGIGAAAHETGMENAAVPLAALPGIDVLLAGHTHSVFPETRFYGHPGADPGRGTISGIPAVMAGSGGSHLGTVRLELEHDGARWRITGHDTRVDPVVTEVPGNNDDAESVRAATEEAHRRTLHYIRRPVGRTAAPLHTYFAMAGDVSAIGAVGEVKRREARAGLGSGAHRDLPVLAAVAPYKSGGPTGPGRYADIPKGRLALRHLAALYPFPNRLAVLRLSGAEVRAWLEHAASVFGTLWPGRRDQPLNNPDLPAHQFDVIVGLTYRIDLTRPPGQGRVRDLRHGGQPVTEDAVFALATNSFRAGGGGGFPGAAEADVLLTSDMPVRDMLARHLETHGVIAPPDRPVWRFAPIPGATAILETGIGALAHGASANALGLEPEGTTADGGARFRLHLDAATAAAHPGRTRSVQT